MPAQNTTSSYGSVTKGFHWLSALLLISAFLLGLIANDLAHEIQSPGFDGSDATLSRAVLLFSIHKTIGVAAFFTGLGRILWALSQPKPGLLHPENKPEALAAEVVHWLLYGAMVATPLTGWIHHAASTGFAPIWWPFGQELPFVAKSDATAALFGTLHWISTQTLMVTFGLHVTGALKHAVVDRDATLRRMLPGTTEAGTPHHSNKAVPFIAAIVLWAVALGIGSGLGLYKAHGETTDRATLEKVQSDWSVQSGTLALSITQFGSEVTGQFEDWTAQITYAPREGPGSHGNVRAVISIGSLTLGSVTGQALGPDFFDANTHPTAEFIADLIYQADGYTAEGTLTIRGVEVPVVMPFELAIEDDVAEMTGRLLLDRRAFNIGDNMPDESSLAFAVNVDVTLTAKRETP